MKKCPFCAEDIQDAAIKCRYCGSVLNGSQSAPASTDTAPAKRFQNIEEYSDVRELARQGKKIEAIKALREKTGWDLKAAKDYVEAIPGVPVDGLKQPIGGRQGLALGAVAIGFLMTVVSATAAGFGIFAIWFGLAFAMKGGVIARWGGGLILALIIGAIGTSVGGRYGGSSGPASTAAPSTSAPSSTAPARSTSPAAPSYQLAIISSKGYETEGGGYHIVEGQVKNISNEPLQNVAAVSTWYDKDGTFIKSDDALIEYNPILPGQTSPFKTMSTTNPAMTKYTVEFKRLFGGTIGTRDDRKR